MRLRTLTEAECYVRCYGSRPDSRPDETVSVMRTLTTREWRSAMADTSTEQELDQSTPKAEAA